MMQAVNLVPELKDVLAGCYDPKGSFIQEPGKPELTYKAEPDSTGNVSLSAAHFECFTLLCRQVRYKPETESSDVGGGGAVVAVKDLATALGKTNPETEVLVKVSVPE